MFDVSQVAGTLNDVSFFQFVEGTSLVTILGLIWRLKDSVHKSEIRLSKEITTSNNRLRDEVCVMFMDHQNETKKYEERIDRIEVSCAKRHGINGV